MVDTIVIFSRRLASFLLQHDCKMVDIRTNGKRAEHIVYIFANTPELHELMAQYINH